MKRKIVAAMCALAVLCTSANVFPMSSVSAARKEKALERHITSVIVETIKTVELQKEKHGRL